MPHVVSLARLAHSSTAGMHVVATRQPGALLQAPSLPLSAQQASDESVQRSVTHLAVGNQQCRPA